MKKIFTTVIAALLGTGSFAQYTQQWKLQDYSIGPTAKNDYNAPFLMADVIQLSASSYIMYYNAMLPNTMQKVIKYATSSDCITWKAGDTVLCGSLDTTNLENEIGGPSVVKLPNGQYRMYYQSCPKPEPNKHPKFHIRSAISSDGIHFTRENGIRMNIKTYDASSLLTLASHGTFYQLPSGTFVSVFSGNFYTDPMNGDDPSDLKIATSSDGLTWSNFKTLYADAHDPIVLKKNNQYILYGMYLRARMITAVSTDGTTWPSVADSVSFLDGSNNSLSVDNSGLGDVGGIVMPDGNIFLYTNFCFYGKSAPSDNIVRFTLQNPITAVERKNTRNFSFGIFPNYDAGLINCTVESDFDDNVVLELYNVTGQLVFSEKEKHIFAGQNFISVNAKTFAQGFYVIKLNGTNQHLQSKLFIVK